MSIEIENPLYFETDKVELTRKTFGPGGRERLRKIQWKILGVGESFRSTLGSLIQDERGVRHFCQVLKLRGIKQLLEYWQVNQILSL